MEKFNQILLIDDDPTCNFTRTRLLDRMGIANYIHCTSNGKEALNWLKTTDVFPEIIFLDLNMPLMNGYEFLVAFNTLFKDKLNVNIVVLTSSEDGQDLDKVQKFGIRYYLTKPLIENNLLKILEIIRLNIKLKFVMLAS